MPNYALEQPSGEVIRLQVAQPLVEPVRYAQEPLSDYPDVLTVNDVAKILGMAKQTVRGLCSRHELPSIRIGRRWYVPKAHLIELLSGDHDA